MIADILNRVRCLVEIFNTGVAVHRGILVVPYHRSLKHNLFDIRTFGQIKMTRFVSWRNRHGVFVEDLIVDSRYRVLIKLVSAEWPHGVLRLLEGGFLKLLISVKQIILQVLLVVQLTIHQIFGRFTLLLNNLASFWLLFYKRLLLLKIELVGS